MMGLIVRPDLESYWRKSDLFETPGFSKIMGRDRYLFILQHLHFNSDPELNKDRISKLRPILDYFLDKFQKIYTPGEYISIDESLVAFKGRLSFKQFNKNKRARFGVKLFVVAESKTAYAYDIIVYCGKEKNENGNAKKEHNVSEKIVLKLVEKLSGHGRKLYVDNWYTSVNLFLKLQKEKKTNACGTVRMNRKYLPKLKTKQMKKRDIKVYHTSKLSFTAWKDKRIVTMLSTMHTPQLIATEKRHYLTGDQIEKPNVVKDYNDYMGGVDKCDQLLGTYKCSRKSKKWYIKVYWHIFDALLTNAHIVYKLKHPNTRMDLKTFRETLVEQIVAKYKPKIRQNTSESQIYNELNINTRRSGHKLIKIPATENCSYPTKRCVSCYAKGVRKNVRVICEKCKVALCKEECFDQYHELN